MGVSGRDQLRRLIDDLGKLPPDLRRELRPGMRRAAHPVLEQMRSNAGWSHRIPAATRIATSLTGSKAGVRLVTDSKRAPHARPIEHDGAPGNFRHPVYGHGDRDKWVWRPQRARPWFWRAVKEQGDAVRDEVAKVVAEVAHKHGF